MVVNFDRNMQLLTQKQLMAMKILVTMLFLMQNQVRTKMVGM